MSARPRLSVIVCIYNMAREAPRTILSAAIPYQQEIAAGEYEVILVDNGSSQPLGLSPHQLPEGVRLVSMPAPRPSPVFAMNWAARELARGDILLFSIDGARIFSDHLYAATLAAHALVSGAFVFTLAWHLGPKVQMVSTREGYDAAAEDRLIADSGWPEQRRSLFDRSVLAGSSQAGFFRPINESSAFSMPRTLFEAVGGYDERFVSPGGGMANLEIFTRYVTRPGARNVCLLSEGTFHQVHGGTATSDPAATQRLGTEYREIIGERFRTPRYRTLYCGGGGMEFLKFIVPQVESRHQSGRRLGVDTLLKRARSHLLR